MGRLLAFSSFLLSSLSLCAAQPDAKSLLRDAAAHYRNAQSFRIEFETKITSSSPFSDGWSEQVYIVATVDHKFHWEQKGSGLSGIRISDGESDWFYRPNMHEYSVQPAGVSKTQSAARSAVGTTEGWIKSAIHGLLNLDEDADSAVMRQGAVLKIGETKIPCHVVRTLREMSFREGTDSVRVNTYWIEKASGLVRKATLVSRGPASVEDESDKTRTVEITYTRVDLDTPPDPQLFQFRQPSDAYLVEDTRQPMSQPTAIGSPAIELKLTDKNGGLFDLAELKGKVVLLDFWTSWCGACLEEMKAIAQLPQSYSDHGLVIVSLDEDETPERGDNYFSSHQFHWRNVHDIGEIHRRTWGVSAFPMLFLVDRDGKVAWTSSGTGANFSETLRSQLDRPPLLLMSTE